MANNRTLGKWMAAGMLMAALAAVMAAPGAAQSREFRFRVSGSGSATATDREQASDDAFEGASEQARAVCAGGNGQISRDRIDRTGTNCVTLGGDDHPTYSCMVFVTAECVSRIR